MVIKSRTYSSAVAIVITRQNLQIFVLYGCFKALYWQIHILQLLSNQTQKQGTEQNI